MYKLIIEKNDGEEKIIIDEINLTDPNVLVKYNGGTLKSFDRIRLNEKQIIDQTPYENIANKLKAEYASYIGHVIPSKILFVIDDEWEPTEKTSINSRWKIKIKKTPGMVRDLTGYDYIIDMRRFWLDQWTKAQTYAAVMSQLLRINAFDGTIFNYTEDYHSKMLATFGAEYLEPDTEIQNMLENKITIHGFEKANGQMEIMV